jgi:hypothetical protein
MGEGFVCFAKHWRYTISLGAATLHTAAGSCHKLLFSVQKNATELVIFEMDIW